jgi:hypothetical protein
MNERNIRQQKGAAVIGLCLALFMFIMLIGFFVFDSSRIQMAQRELTATCDSASLAGTAMLTSYPTANDAAPSYPLTVAAQAGACQYARNMFQAGNLLGQSLAGANVVSTYSAVGVTGAPGSTNVMIALADPTNNYLGVNPAPPGCLAGKAIMCYACYTYTPVFLWIVGVQNVGLNAASGGGLPQVDAVLVFDYSGSMDDASNVSFVRRTWDSTITCANAGAASYNATDYPRLVTNAYGNSAFAASLPAPPAASVYPGSLYQDVSHSGCVHYIEITPPTPGDYRMSDQLNFQYTNNPNGTQLNCLPPQNMDVSQGDSGDNPYFTFDQNLRSNTNPWRTGVTTTPVSNGLGSQANGGNWQTDYGTPPGNCTLSPPYGYGNFWIAPSSGAPPAQPMPLVSSYNTAGGPGVGSGGGAYWTQTVSFTGFYPDQLMNNPTNYVAQDYTSLGSYREFTDIVVNIADPGTWPYTQPLNGVGPFTSSAGFSFTFPTQEPDNNIQGKTFNFEDLGVLVEASRGNLDNANNANGALLDRGAYYTIQENGVIKSLSAVSVAHATGFYQEAYQRLAMLFSQPIATSVDGADGGFFQKINSLCDCRFGFVGFSDASTVINAPPSSVPNSLTQGTSQTTGSTAVGQPNSFFVTPEYYSAPQFGFWWDGVSTSASGLGGASNTSNIVGGNGAGFRQPRRPLKFSDTQPNSLNGVDGCRLNSSFSGGVTAGYSADWHTNNVSANAGDANGLENGSPQKNTDTYEALNTARYMFRDPSNYDITNLSLSRPAAKHAIVFFTDGVPTGGVASTDANGALSVATACKGDGTAIYAIGMDVTGNATLQSDQQIFLGASGGLSGNASNGSKAFYCSSSGTVQQAFYAVARRLSQSQR